MSDQRFILSAVMYSPNLGDGVIAECMSRAAGVDTTWLDLAGRRGFEGPGNNRRAHVLRVLDALPATISHGVAAKLVRTQIRSRLQPLLARELPGAAGLILGGGQIFADAHMNFPLKIAAVNAQAKRDDVPMAIHGVGVSKTWSSAASELFCAVFSDRLAHIAVRDDASRDNLARHLSLWNLPVPDIHVFPDPGFLASRYFPAKTPKKEGIGLGITHPAPLVAHGGKDLRLSLRSYVLRYADLVTSIASSGTPVTLFTNGASEDEACLRSVFASLPASIQSLVRVAPRCDTPQDFMTLISGFAAVLSHRMHAAIVAHSYNVPCFGLSWDAKMTACFDIMDRKCHLLNGRLDNPDAIAEHVLDARGAGATPDSQHLALLDNAERGVKMAVNALGAVTGHRQADRASINSTDDQYVRHFDVAV